MAANRPVTDLAPGDVLERLRGEISQDAPPKQIEQDLRSKLDSYHLEGFQRTQTETTKRWTYESEVKRPYFHVTELDDQQLVNWRKYLDFEESEGDYTRTKFLYERCLVTAANYEDMWLRYARWMLAQDGKQEEVRNIYSRASCIYVPISRPTVRLFYAQFEESEGRPDVAAAIHEGIIMAMPNNIEAIVSLANVHRRQYGLESAIDVIKKYIDSTESTIYTRGSLVSEWARLVWKGTADTDAARQIYQSNEQLYLDCRAFWVSWLEFEMQQPTSDKEEPGRYQWIRKVFDGIRKQSRLLPDVIKELSAMYFVYLKERGGKDAMKEYMQLDQEINGPLDASGGAPADAGKEGTTQKTLANGNLPKKKRGQQGA